MNRHYAQVAERADHRCEYCHAPEAVFNFPFEVEHVVPSGRGGTNEKSNLALSCRACNLYKSNLLEARDPETKVNSVLFHPRKNRWDEHFAIDQKSARLVGRTVVGRATVEGLKMNRPAQVSARRQWMLLQLFPDG